MTQIGMVPEINAVKTNLAHLKAQGFIKEWELPYEELLTRLTAAIFFLTPTNDIYLEQIWKELEKHEMLHYRKNDEKKLSLLMWRVEFN